MTKDPYVDHSRPDATGAWPGCACIVCQKKRSEAFARVDAVYARQLRPLFAGERVLEETVVPTPLLSQAAYAVRGLERVVLWMMNTSFTKELARRTAILTATEIERQRAGNERSRYFAGVDFGQGPGLAVAREVSAAQAAAKVNDGKASHLPSGAAERKAIPIATGLVDYFPDALVAIAAISKIGGEQHNPGKPLFWDRTKSTDEADTLLRHFLDRGTYDTDGCRHSAKVAWRALALLQKEIEADRADNAAEQEATGVRGG